MFPTVSAARFASPNRVQQPKERFGSVLAINGHRQAFSDLLDPWFQNKELLKAADDLDDAADYDVLVGKEANENKVHVELRHQIRRSKTPPFEFFKAFDPDKINEAIDWIKQRPVND